MVIECIEQSNPYFHFWKKVLCYFPIKISESNIHYFVYKCSSYKSTMCTNVPGTKVLYITKFPTMYLSSATKYNSYKSLQVLCRLEKVLEDEMQIRVNIMLERTKYLGSGEISDLDIKPNFWS